MVLMTNTVACSSSAACASRRRTSKLGEAGFVPELDPATGTITIPRGISRPALWFAGETLVYESETASARAT